MHDQRPSSFDANEQPTGTVERDSAPALTNAAQALLSSLIERGFTWEESLRLLSLHDHLYELPEVQQRMCDDPHLQFARWLYEQGEISG
jgi:hypothetical protein